MTPEIQALEARLHAALTNEAIYFSRALKLRQKLATVEKELRVHRDNVDDLARQLEAARLAVHS